ncbi:MAG: phosphoribosylpyrophosphate synthetase [Bacteroidetes bacterium]|nr:phosphoribosylpyrophosphate synthetase [Bacteroidota bacterium]
MVLNLDKSFAPLGRDQEIAFQAFTFSGGEPHIKIEADFDPAKKVVITHRLNSFNDLGLLCMAVDALRRMGVKEMELFIPYFPAARQDRLMVSGEPLSVKVYANIINGLHLDKVLVFDPHSDVTPALIDHCEVVANHNFIKQVVAQIGSDVKLISPDGGALKKIYKVSVYLGGTEVIECSKSRDVETGQLSGFKVYHDGLGGADCLIVDDICDGGGTFAGLADALKAKGAGNLYLAVSHGIFSKGFEELSKSFKMIFTTDSFKNINEVNGVTQIRLDQYMK